jgi:hypothetical protein
MANMMCRALSLCAFVFLAVLPCRAGTPLTPEQQQFIPVRAEAAGCPVDLAGAAETVEDPAILYVPSPDDPARMLLYDTVSTRAVAAEQLGLDGFRFQLVDPARQPALTELHLSPDGYFGPEEALTGLGLTDAALAEQQAVRCKDACFEQPNMDACTSCTSVGLLLALRNALQPPATPVPDDSPSAAPSEAAQTPQPVVAAP